jgi:hypothetical protein
MPTKESIDQAQETAKNLTVNPTQETQYTSEDIAGSGNAPSVTEYDRIMYTPNENVTTGWQRVQSIIGEQYETYTDWYEANGKKHVTGFQNEGIVQLKQERIVRLANKYERGEIGRLDFLMESVGYELLEREYGGRFDDPVFWYKRFSNFDFYDPRKNASEIERVSLLAANYLSESELGKTIFSGQSMFDKYSQKFLAEYVSGEKANDFTMAEVFGDIWEEVKEEWNGDIDLALRSLQGVNVQGRFNETGTKYIHTDGRIYDVVEEGREGSDATNVARIKYQKDNQGNITGTEYMIINGNQITGNIFLDNLVAGTLGFAVDMAKFVAQLAVGLGDIARGRDPETNKIHFDNVVNMAVAFEGFKNDSLLLNKAYIDMDGKALNSFNDWMDAGGDIAGLILGMKLLGWTGGWLGKVGKVNVGVAGAPKWITNPAYGAIRRAAYAPVNATGFVLQSMNQIHVGSWANNTNYALLSRGVFAMTYAGRDALNAYSTQVISGRSQEEAKRLAATVFAVNSLITMTIGSTSKDDTFKFYAGMVSKTGKRVGMSRLATKGFWQAAQKWDPIITSGLDFFDNYMTMTIASMAASQGRLPTLGDFITEANPRSIITSALFAMNAYRGSKRGYQTKTIPNKALEQTVRDFETRAQEIINDKNVSNEDKQSIIALRLDMNEKIREGNLIDAIEVVHQAVKDDLTGQSFVSKQFAQLTKDFNAQTFKDIYESVQELQNSHIENSGKYFKNILTHGFFRGTWNTYRTTTDAQGNLRNDSYKYWQSMIASDVAELKRISGDVQLSEEDIWRSMGELVMGVGYRPDDLKAEVGYRIPERFNDIFDESPEGFSYDAQREAYLVTLKGFGTDVQASDEYRGVERILIRMAELGLIARNEADPSNRSYYFPASTGALVHAAEVVHRTYEAFASIGNPDLTTEALIRIAEKIAPLMKHGMIENLSEQDMRILTGKILADANELKYLKDRDLQRVLEILYKDNPEDLEEILKQSDHLSRHIQAMKFAELLLNTDENNQIKIDEVPSDPAVVKILENMFPEAGNNIRDIVEQANTRRKESPQWFASNFYSINVKPSEEDFEITFEADSALNEGKPIADIFKVDGYVDPDVTSVKKVRKAVADRLGVTVKDLENSNISTERRIELLRQMAAMENPPEGFGYIQSKIQTDLKLYDIFNFFYRDITDKNGETFKTQEIRVAPGKFIIDRATFIPKEGQRIFEVVKNYKPNEENLRNNPEDFEQYLKAHGIELSRLQKQLDDWNDQMRMADQTNRFVEVDIAYLRKFGYKDSDFNFNQASPFRGIINGSVLEKAFELKNSVDTKVETIKETVQVEEFERYIIGNAIMERGNEFGITEDTILIGGTFNVMLNGILSDRNVQANAPINFIRYIRKVGGVAGNENKNIESNNTLGDFRVIEVDEQVAENAFGTSLLNRVLELNIDKDTRIKINYPLDQRSNMNDEFITRYFTLITKGDDVFVSDLKTDVVLQDLEDGTLSLSQLMLLRFMPKDITDEGLYQQYNKPFASSDQEFFKILNNFSEYFSTTKIKQMIDGDDIVIGKYSAENWTPQSNRVGDIIAEIEAIPLEQRNDLQNSILRNLQFYLKNEMTTKEKVLVDFDLLRFASRNTIDDVLLEIERRQTQVDLVRTPFESAIPDMERDTKEFLITPATIRGVGPVFVYDLNNPRVVADIKNTINKLVERSTTNFEVSKVKEEDTWKSLIHEVDGKQYILYDHIKDYDEDTINDLRMNLSSEDQARFDTVIEKLEDMNIGLRGLQEPFEYRKALNTLNQPTIKESFNAILSRKNITKENLDILVERATKHVDTKARNIEVKNVETALNSTRRQAEINIPLQLREAVERGTFLKQYEDRFGKDGSDILESSMLYENDVMLLDAEGNLIQRGFGTTSILEFAFKDGGKALENGKWLVTRSLFAKTPFETPKIEFVDLDSTFENATVREKILEKGYADVYTYLTRNVNERINDGDAYAEFVRNPSQIQKAREAFEKDPNSVDGKNYQYLIKQINYHIDNRLNKKQTTHNTIVKLITGKTDELTTPQEILQYKVLKDFFNNFFRKPQDASLTMFDLAIAGHLKGLDFLDMRMANNPSLRKLESMIEGVDIGLLGKEDFSLINQKISLMEKEYLNNIDATVVQEFFRWSEDFIRETNRDDIRTPKIPAIPDSVKALDVEDFKKLIYVSTLKNYAHQKENPNAHKYLLTSDYDYDFESMKMEYKNGVNFKYEDKLGIKDKIIFYFAEDFKNKQLILNVGRERSEEDNNLPQVKRVFNLDNKGDQGRLKTWLNTIKNEKNSIIVLDGTENAESTKYELENLFRIYTGLRPDEPSIYNADLAKRSFSRVDLLNNLFLKGTYTELNDSLESQRIRALDLAEESIIGKQGLENIKNILSKKVGENPAENIELMRTIVNVARRAIENGVTFNGGRAYGDMEKMYQEVAKQIGLSVDEFDFLPNRELASERLGTTNKPERLFGLDATANKIVDIQQTKEALDFIQYRGEVYSVATHKLFDTIRNFNISETAAERIQIAGVEKLAKLQNFLLSEPGKKYLEIFNKNISSKDTGKKLSNIADILTDRNLNSIDNFKILFGDKAEEVLDAYNRYKYDNNIAGEKLVTDEVQRKLHENVLHEHDNVLQPIFSFLNDTLKSIIPDSQLENIHSAFIESYFNRFSLDQEYIEEFKNLTRSELPLIKYMPNFNQAIQGQARLELDRLLRGVGEGITQENYSYQNIRPLQAKTLYNVITKDGEVERRINANEIGISEKRAEIIFGSDYDPDELYGTALRWPTIREASKLPMKYVVIKGLDSSQVIMDLNVLKSIEGDVDGDNIGIFGATNKSQANAYKFLNQILLKPYTELQELLRDESRPVNEDFKMLATTRIYAEFMSHIEKFKKDASYAETLTKNLEAEDAAEVKKLLVEYSKKDLNIADEKFLKNLAIKNDQQRGMILKSYQTLSEKFIDNVEEFYKERTDILGKSQVRPISVTDSFMVELEARGYSEEERARIVTNINNKFLAGYASKENNETFNELIDIIDADPDAKFQIREAIEMADKFNNFYKDLFEVDKESKYFFPTENRLDLQRLQSHFNNVAHIKDEGYGTVQVVRENYELYNRTKATIVVVPKGSMAQDVYYPTRKFVDSLQQLTSKEFMIEPGFERTNELRQVTNIANQTIKNLVSNETMQRHLIDVMVGKMVSGSKKSFGDSSEYDKTYFDQLRTRLEIASKATTNKELFENLRFIKEQLDGPNPFYKNDFIKQALFLNLLNKKGVYDRNTKVSDILNNAKFVEALEKLYDQAGAGNLLDSDLRDASERMDMRMFESTIKDLREMHEKGRFPVYKGMPILINTSKQGKNRFVYSSVNGFIEFTENGNMVLINITGGGDDFTAKIAVNESAQFKATANFGIMDTDEGDIIISEANITGKKINPGVISELENYREVTVPVIGEDGTKRMVKGFAFDGDVNILEDMKLWDLRKGKEQSPLIRMYDKGKTDIASLIGNVMTAVGRVEYTGEELKTMQKLYNEYKKYPAEETDMSLPLANLKYELILSYLPKNLQKELLGTTKEEFNYGKNMSNNIANYLLNAEKFLKDNGITIEDVSDGLYNRIVNGLKDPSNFFKKQLRNIINGALTYDDYAEMTVLGKGEDTAVGKDPELYKRQFKSNGNYTTGYEDGFSHLEMPQTKKLPFTQFMERLGLYYDTIANQELLELGIIKPNAVIKGGVNASFRGVPKAYANTIDPDMATASIVASDKVGRVSDGTSLTFFNRVNKPGEQKYTPFNVSDEAIKNYKLLLNTKDPVNPIWDKKKYFAQRLLDVSNEAIRTGNSKNSDFVKLKMLERPHETNASRPFLMNALNFAVDKNTGRLGYTPTITKTNVDYDINNPNTVNIKINSNVEAQLKRDQIPIGYDPTKKIYDKDNIIVVNFKPIPNDVKQFGPGSLENPQAWNERFASLRQLGIPTNEIESLVKESDQAYRITVPNDVRSRGLFAVLNRHFDVIKGSDKDNTTYQMKRDLLSSTNISYLDKDLGAESHMVLRNAKHFKTATYDLYAGRIGMLYMRLSSVGREALDQFWIYYNYQKVLLDLDAHQKLNKSLSVEKFIDSELANDLKKVFGVDTIQEAIKEMQEFNKNYSQQNNSIVRELEEITRELLTDYREGSAKLNNPIDNGYVLSLPVIKRSKDRGKLNFLTKQSAIFNPKKFDQQIFFLEQSNPFDPFDSMLTMASEIGQMRAVTQVSKFLSEQGLIKNEKIKTMALDIGKKAVDEQIKKEGSKAYNEFITKLVGDLSKYLDREYVEILTSRYVPQTTHNFGMLMESFDAIRQVVYWQIENDLNLTEKITTYDQVLALMRNDAHAPHDALLRKSEEALAYLDAATGLLVRNTEAVKGFKDSLEQRYTKNFNIVDRYGRLMVGDNVKPLTESSTEYIAENIKQLDDSYLFEKAMKGELYIGNKVLTDTLDKYLYTFPVSNKIKDALKIAAETGNRFIMGNPLRILRRMEQFTFTDMMMLMMAHPKSFYKADQARKDLSQAMESKNKIMSDDLKEFVQLMGNTVSNNKFLDYFNRELITKDPLKKESIGDMFLNPGLTLMNFQHHLSRYTLYLAFKDDLNKHGKIKTWGAAYPYRKVISKYSPEEQAYNAAMFNIATFGDMPSALRYTYNALTFTSFLLGQVRWARDWGFAMKEAGLDLLSALRGGAQDAADQDVAAAFKTVAIPSLSIGLGGAIGAMILNFVADIFNVDEETKEEWLEERKYLQLTGTVINGSPTFSSSQANPIRIPFDSTIGAAVRGFRGEKGHDGGLVSAVKSFVNSTITSRLNPLIKIPFESIWGKTYFGELAVDDSYSNGFFDNLIRKSAGYLLGAGAVNSFIDSARFYNYRDDEYPMLTTFAKGMQNAIGSEFGNSKAYNQKKKHLYMAREIIYEKGLVPEGKAEFTSRTDAESDANDVYNNNYDKTKADDLTSTFRKIMNRGEPMSVMYNIIAEELNNGTSVATIHAAINRVSVSRLINRLDDPQGFMDSLTDQEFMIVRNALKFEQEIFPSIETINLYNLVGSKTQKMPSWTYKSYQPNTYYREPYIAPEYRKQNRRKTPYENMSTYHPYYEHRSIYDRWTKEKPKR